MLRGKKHWILVLLRLSLRNNMNQSQPEWEKEFDKKFVVDEGSVELKENGEMGWAVDTRLIADYIDGKTLTAKHIKDFIRSLLLKTRTAEQERVVGKLKGALPDLSKLPADAKAVTVRFWQGYRKGVEACIEELTN